MTDKNLPAQTTGTQMTLAPKMVPAILMFGGLAGVFFTPFDIIFSLLIVLGFGLFVARALVKKLVEATQGLSEQDPFLAELKTLEHKVAQTKYLNKVSALGEKAHAQARELKERYVLINGTLEKKFQPGELAYSRYQTAVASAAQSLSDNLKLITANLTSIDLASTPSEEQSKLVDELLSDNKETLRLFSELSFSLNQINAGGTLDASLEHSMSELKRLTEQAKKYSR